MRLLPGTFLLNRGMIWAEHISESDEEWRTCCGAGDTKWNNSWQHADIIIWCQTCEKIARAEGEDEIPVRPTLGTYLARSSVGGASG